MLMYMPIPNNPVFRLVFIPLTMAAKLGSMRQSGGQSGTFLAIISELAGIRQRVSQCAEVVELVDTQR